MLTNVVDSYRSKRMYQVLVEDRQLTDQAARKANGKVREQQAEIDRLRELVQDMASLLPPAFQKIALDKLNETPSENNQPAQGGE